MRGIALLATVGAASAAGLRDHPIGGSATQYLDSSSWIASMQGKRPAGCKHVQVQPSLSMTANALVLTSVPNREHCCARCWADALCSSALHTPDGRCWLQTPDEMATTSAVSLTEQDSSRYIGEPWTRCHRVRGGPEVSLSIPARVPGDLISDLQAAGQIGDPYFEKTWLNSSIWHDHLWTYTVRFAASQKVISCARSGGQVLLVFDGIKMGAHISLDGKPLGIAADQFLRYTFDVTSIIAAVDANAEHTLNVSFDPMIDVDGRFAACTGGWDWAPYSHTYAGGAHTFSKGIWKSVYLSATWPTSAAILHVVPQITYRGSYPTARLADGAHAGFNVSVRVHLSVRTATQGTLVLTTAWHPGASVRKKVALPAGESNATLHSSASADEIELWWPNGVGNRQQLYNLTVAFVPAGAADGSKRMVNASRSVGFRYIALVTGNDTDPSYVASAATSEGTSSHGMFVRVNGVPIYARGANVIPMEELEGRLSAKAHEVMVDAAVASRFNMLRVWGGGMFLPDAFYDACDARGLLVYHDMQYAQSGHAPRASKMQELELRHAIRRLSAHPSIALWDGCNECQVVMSTPTAIYATFVMTVVAQEDASRAIWPSCPALGWTSGVRMLDALPNGHNLTTPKTKATIETHGPYLHGSGFPAVNGDPKLLVFKPSVPIRVSSAPTGIGLPNVFASEFGAAVMSSFESMAPTLAPEHWGLHGGQPDDECPGGFERHCTGPNVMAERNYPCDNLIDVYFGTQPAGYFNRTGEAVFKRQLYQCMLAQAIHMKADIETRRSKNEIGLLVWQFNEIWPTVSSAAAPASGRKPG